MLSVGWRNLALRGRQRELRTHGVSVVDGRQRATMKVMNGDALRNGTGRARLLIVDDDPDTLRSTERMARVLGFECVATTRPAEAVHLMSGGERFAALITGVSMPELPIPTLYVVGSDPCERSPSSRLARPFQLHELARKLESLDVTVPVLGHRGPLRIPGS